MKNMLPLLAISNVIIDSVKDENGNIQAPIAGGAGLYAAIAMAHVWPKVALLAGVGKDFDKVTNNIADEYNFFRSGCIVRDRYSIQSQLTYYSDGSRTEVPTYGQKHFSKMQMYPSDIPNKLLPAIGTYIFRDLDCQFWTEILAIRKKLGLILWELDDSVTIPNNLKRISEIAKVVDIVSFNLAEASQLFSTSNPEILVQCLLDLGAPNIILRMGSKGALIANQISSFHIHPPLHPVVDVTGGGNSFSAGFLAGLCQDNSNILCAARYAAASAAIAIAHRGPPSRPLPSLFSKLYAASEIEKSQKQN